MAGAFDPVCRHASAVPDNIALRHQDIDRPRLPPGVCDYGVGFK